MCCIQNCIQKKRRRKKQKEKKDRTMTEVTGKQIEANDKARERTETLVEQRKKGGGGRG